MSRLREWRIRKVASAWISTAFLISFLSAEMVKAICVVGFITGCALFLLSWGAQRSDSRELGTFQ